VFIYFHKFIKTYFNEPQVTAADWKWIQFRGFKQF